MALYYCFLHAFSILASIAPDEGRITNETLYQLATDTTLVTTDYIVSEKSKKEGVYDIMSAQAKKICPDLNPNNPCLMHILNVCQKSNIPVVRELGKRENVGSCMILKLS